MATRDTLSPSRFRACLWLLILFLPLFTATAASAGRLIRVGAYQDPPAIWSDDRQRVQGFLPDLLEHIARREDWQIEYVPIHWCESIEALKNGRVDLLPGAYPVSGESSGFTLSELPIYLDWGQVYTRSGTEIQTVLDLDDKRVAVEASCVFIEGESGLRRLAERFKVNIDFRSFTNATDALQDLYADRTDAIVLGRFYNNMPEMSDDIVKTPILLNPVTVYFAAPQGGYEPYLKIIDAHIRELKADRTSLYYQSWNKWFSRSLGPRLPKWLLHLAATLGGVALLLLGFSLFARHQVAKKTGEISEKNARLRSLSMALTLAEEAERRRLAELLHDHLGQNLALTKIRLGTMEKKAAASGCQEALADIKGFLDEAIGVTRSLTAEMSPLALYNLPFSAALKWLAETLLRGHGIEVELIGDGRDLSLPEDTKVLLFKTVRELLVNIVKHARADYVKMKLKTGGDQLVLAIADNGIGFMEGGPVAEGERGGFGLMNIRERLTYLGGCFEIDSRARRGTVARLRIPLEPGLTGGSE